VIVDGRLPDVLTREQCLELLASGRLGRVALSESALPVVVPVRYELEAEGVIVGPDADLDVRLGGAVVAFEVDEIDPDSNEGWSVQVTGVARQVRREDEARGRLVISTEVMSGRRIGSR
jgi:nitroimidazol reductase NimA-like FMN-containing flavoprotein (pyridoxamine 5'-phosphate oxidase superfamily)